MLFRSFFVLQYYFLLRKKWSINMKKTTALQNILGAASFIAVALLSSQAMASDVDESAAAPTVKKSDMLQQVLDKHMAESTRIKDLWQAATKTAEEIGRAHV